VKNSDLLAAAGNVARKVRSGAVELVDGLAESKVAVTPEGLKYDEGSYRG